MIIISKKVQIHEDEVEIKGILAHGPGGQNVNKVSTAVQLRFNIPNSSLPESYKEKLFLLKDSRITNEKEIVIKSQKFRSFEKNKEDAIERLVNLIKKSVKTQKKRRPTKPTIASKTKRLDKKAKHSNTKILRKKVKYIKSE